MKASKVAAWFAEQSGSLTLLIVGERGLDVEGLVVMVNRLSDGEESECSIRKSKRFRGWNLQHRDRSGK